MNVLVVGAHWDDIELGCALTLKRLSERGAAVYGAVLTNSDYVVTADGHSRSASEARTEGLAIFEAIGVTHVATTPLRNLSMVYDQRVMQELEAVARDRAIDVVFTHWHGDANTDHAATWEISRVAFRCVRNVLQYQSNAYFDNIVNFLPHFFFGFNATEYEGKRSIIAMHESEWRYRETRWQREIFDRERHWGFLCGCDYAEAFMVSRLCDANGLGFGPFPADS